MPELPEVEVVRLGLAPAVTGALVTGVDVLDDRALTRHDRALGEFEDALVGRRILGTARRGKFLWMPLSLSDRRAAPQARIGAGFDTPASPAARPAALLAHLGMTGQLLLRTPDAPRAAHLRVRITLEHPEHGEIAVHFVDQRTFGSLAVDRLVSADSGGEVPTQVAHIARDPLDALFDDAAFVAALCRKDSAVKRVLLDQTVVSGVGNIYADEALWAARIHPQRIAKTLSARQARTLLAEVHAVFQRALAEGGTSFDAQYVNVNGQAGYFARSLGAYGRTGQPCPRCGTAIVRVAFANRSSHFCPRCQRL